MWSLKTSFILICVFVSERIRRWMHIQRNHRATPLQHVLFYQVLQRKENLVPGSKSSRTAAKSPIASAPATGKTFLVHQSVDTNGGTGTSRRAPSSTTSRPHVLLDNPRIERAFVGFLFWPPHRPSALPQEEKAEEEKAKMPSRCRKRHRTVPQKT